MRIDSCISTGSTKGIARSVNAVKNWLKRIMLVGLVKVHSTSRNKVYHKQTCRYVQGEARTGMFLYFTKEEATLQGFRPCYICYPECKPSIGELLRRNNRNRKNSNKMDKQWETSDSDDSWNEVSEEKIRAIGEPSSGCGKLCYWCNLAMSVQHIS